MRKFTKILCVMLCLAMLAALFSACTSYKPDDGTTVLKLGKYKVTYDEYAFHYYGMLEMEAETQKAFGDPRSVEKIAHSMAVENLRKIYGRASLAAEYGVKLPSATRKGIDEDIKSLIKYYGGEDNLIEELAKSHITVYSMREDMRADALWNELYDYMISLSGGKIKSDDKTVSDAINDGLIIGWSACIIPLVNDKAAALQSANAAIADIAAGERFSIVAQRYGVFNDAYNSQSGVTQAAILGRSGGLYTFYSDIISALPVGGVSGIIETDYAYFIINRTELTAEYVSANFDNLRGLYATYMFNVAVDERGNSLELSILRDDLIYGKE